MQRAFLTALVLAAGSSRRLGRPKQLLPFGGTTLLGWVVAQAEASPELDEVLVVLGHARQDIQASLTPSRARPIFAVEFSEGCAASYRAGLAAADPRAEGALIALGDQPGVDTEAIGRVAAVWRAEGGDLVAASYQGVLGHPLVFGRRLFRELAALHGDKAAWKLLDRYADRVRAADLERPLPADVDTLADYAALAHAKAGSDALGEHVTRHEE